MNFKFLLATTGLCLIALVTFPQCQTLCTVKVTNSKTSKAVSHNYKVAVKTGWQLWSATGDEAYRANSTFIYALVYMSDRTVVMRAFKGSGPDLIWSGKSPSVNCETFPWGGFSVIDGSGNKGFIKAKSN